VMIQYANISYELEHISRWDEKAVYSDDGADFLYIHVTIGVQCVFHPGATRDKDGDMGAASVASLRQVMLTPRRQLRVTVGNTVVLESPGKRPGGDRNFTVDAKNGPQPLGFQVLEVRSEKTFVLYYEIETWVNLCCSPALLSHRWEMTHEISELFMTRRTIVGSAVFRSDFLRDYPQQPVRYPDDFRQRLFHPVEDGFQRKTVKVVMASDSLSAEYVIVDEQQWLNLGLNSPIARIEAEWKRGIVGGESPFNPGDLGSRYVAFAVHAWGSTRCLRQDLINACFKAAASFKLDNKGTPFSRRSYYNADMRVNAVAKEAELTVGFYTGSALGRAVNYFNPVFDEADRLIQAFPEDIDGVGSVVPGPNPRPPFGFGSRGSVAGRMVAQALMGRCDTPPKPPAAREDPKFLDF
jgi:hypothetical protein